MKAAKECNAEWEAKPHLANEAKWSAARIEWIREIQREAFDAGALAVIHAMETRGVTFKLEKALVDLVPATLEGRP